MEFRDVVRRRHMVRSYTPDPVDPVVVDRMLAHAQRAPSAGFSQGWAFLVLDTPDDVHRFWNASTPDDRPVALDKWIRGMRRAPVVIVPLSSEAIYRRRYAEPDKQRSAQAEGPWPIPYWHVDAGMAALLILQTAVDERLGACFFGITADRIPVLRHEFGIPDDYTPVGAITVGHDDGSTTVSGSPRTRPRRPFEEVVHRGRWTSHPSS
jgi:nitroreductase